MSTARRRRSKNGNRQPEFKAFSVENRCIILWIKKLKKVVDNVLRACYYMQAVAETDERKAKHLDN